MATREVALFLLTAFNALSDQWTAFCAGASKVANGFWHYFTGTTNRWYFLPNAAVPIPASYYLNRNYGLENQDTIRLEYDTALGVLTYRPRRIAEPRSLQRMPWLSASLSVNGRIFNMDNWARTFRFDMITQNGGWFTPRTFVSCWSIDTKIWPTPTDNVFLNLIDNEGNPYQFTVFGEYDENTWLRCLGDTDSETETDEEGEVEEVETEGSETEEDEEDDASEESDAEADAPAASAAPANSLSVSPVSATTPVTEATAEAAVTEEAPQIIDGVSAFQRSLGAEAPAPAPADVQPVTEAVAETDIAPATTATVATVMASVMAEPSVASN
jgi:hypothetical protein